MDTITRDELKQMMDSNKDLRVVEVLSQDQFENFHLPGAINVPLDDHFEQRIQREVPDKQREVVVYCADESCPASPKAAEKMDALGYENVYDYEAGKADWREAGLDVEGQRA